MREFRARASRRTFYVVEDFTEAPWTRKANLGDTIFRRARRNGDATFDGRNETLTVRTARISRMSRFEGLTRFDDIRFERSRGNSMPARYPG